MTSTFDGEDAVAIVASVFSHPGDRIEAERWDAPLRTPGTAGHAASFLRVHGMSAAAARAAARAGPAAGPDRARVRGLCHQGA